MMGTLKGFSPLKKKENVDIKSKVKFIFQSSYENNIKIENVIFIQFQFRNYQNLFNLDPYFQSLQWKLLY
jgi:hypothetical protein